MRPLRRGRTICACAIFLTAPILSAQTAPPTLSAGSVLLPAGKDDPASVATLTAAHQGADASVRAAAARVIGTGRYPLTTSGLQEAGHQPTLLNGTPVGIIMTVTSTFTLK